MITAKPVMFRFSRSYKVVNIIQFIYLKAPGSFSIEASQYNNPLELLHQLYSDHPDHQHITVGDFPTLSGPSIFAVHTKPF